MAKSITSALRIALIYVAFAALWILFSDLAVESLFRDPAIRSQAQTYKGLCFVFITGVMLFLLVLRNNRIIAEAHDLDPLTGLYNITLFKRRLDRLLKALQPHERLVMGYLDIDKFSEINQQIGFEKADALLIDIAMHIEHLAIRGSVVARLQADQFASARRLDASFNLEEHVNDFQKLVRVRAEKFGLKVTSCIGVAIYPDDGKTSKELMQAATESLRRAKLAGNQVQYHDKSLAEMASQQRQLVADLKDALRKESISVVYQPKYRLNTLQPCGVEVLARWNHPTRGAISPGVFIPVAEEHDLCHEVSGLVFTKAARELEASGLLGKPLKHVSLNISATEFNSEAKMLTLVTYLKRFPTFMPHVRIEITETATLTDMKKSAEIISRLHAEGVTFSVDDFGTGYTSLSMLKDLTVDEIKIDRSFVADIHQDTRSSTIIQAIIAMAKSFNISVVAEGVETAEQMHTLKEMGCEEIQGYYLGKPMPIADLVTHLTQTENTSSAANVEAGAQR